VPDRVTHDVSCRIVALRSARSLITNQSICARSGVRSRTEKPWSSKLRYFTCRLLALIVVSTAIEAVRGGVPVMSFRLLEVTELQTSSTPAESPSG